jgi:hypothetical protein
MLFSVFCSGTLSQQLVCRQCADFVLFYPHLDSARSLADWAARHLKLKQLIESDMFVDIVTRLAALYTLVETPQQNVGNEDHNNSKKSTTKQPSQQRYVQY